MALWEIVVVSLGFHEAAAEKQMMMKGLRMKFVELEFDGSMSLVDELLLLIVNVELDLTQNVMLEK